MDVLLVAVALHVLAGIAAFVFSKWSRATTLLALAWVSARVWWAAS
jgi:hypothetical protein